MPQPPEGKPPKIEDIAVEAKDVTSKPPRGDDLTLRDKIRAILEAGNYQKRGFNEGMMQRALSGFGGKDSELASSFGLPRIGQTDRIPDDILREYLNISMDEFNPEYDHILPKNQEYYEKTFERLGLDPKRVSDFLQEPKEEATKKVAPKKETKQRKQKGTSKKVVSDVPPSTKKPKTKKSGKKPTTPPAKKKDDFKIPKFINQDTNRDVLERIADMAEDGNEEAYKTLLNNSGDLEDHFPDIHERYEELRSVRKSFILKDPFANPFHNPNFLDTIDIRREMAQPMSPIIKSQPIKEQVKPDIGFDTVEGDDLSLLPASIFMGQDNSVGMDDMSLLPTGWRNE
tara:strand:+ start:1 stop:1029 length:1029 start_codon:yes stop_codon:yes gene_type:complete